MLDPTPLNDASQPADVGPRSALPLELTYGRERLSRRQRWIKTFAKWFGLLIAALALLLIVSHTVWLVVMSVRLDRAVAALTAAGEPMTIAAISPPVVPAAENGFDELTAIGDRLEQSTPAKQRRNAFFNIEPPLTSFERKRMAARMDEVAGELPQLEHALAMPKLVATNTFTSPLERMVLPELGGQQQAAAMLADVALLAHDAGRHGEAIKRLELISRIAAAIGSTPMLHSAFITGHVRTMQAERVAQIVPTLRIGNGPEDATPTAVRGMIASLLDSSAVIGEMHYALCGDRVETLETINMIGRNKRVLGMVPASNAVGRYLLRPYFESNSLATLSSLNSNLVSFDTLDWPTAKAQFSARKASLSWANAMASILTIKSERAISSIFRVRTDRVIAAVALAVRWYEVDHGRRPATLVELVPAYLPAVPDDPCAAKGVPLSARLGGDDPIVWSDGENCVDDHGDETSLTRPGFEDKWECRDRVHHLIPRPRQFHESDARLAAIDSDGPIGAGWIAPVTAAVSGEPFPFPRWKFAMQFDVAGDAGVMEFTARRDVIRALDESHFDATPSLTRPATPPALTGTATFDDGVWYFELWPDGRGVFHTPDGRQAPVDRPPGKPDEQEDDL